MCLVLAFHFPSSFTVAFCGKNTWVDKKVNLGTQWFSLWNCDSFLISIDNSHTFNAGRWASVWRCSDEHHTVSVLGKTSERAAQQIEPCDFSHMSYFHVGLFCTTPSAILPLRVVDITSLLQLFTRMLLSATLTMMSDVFCLISCHSKLPFKTVLIRACCSFCNVYSEYHDEPSFSDYHWWLTNDGLLPEYNLH